MAGFLASFLLFDDRYGVDVFATKALRRLLTPVLQGFARWCRRDKTITTASDQIATSGLETLAGILLSAARTAAAGRGDEALEGLTRLSQTAVFWISEIAAPRLGTAAQILAVVEEARALAREALSKPDAPVLPFRRKFTEMNQLIQRSLPDQYQAFPVEIGTRAIAFFTALADKDANVKDLHAELDKALEKLAVPLRAIK